MTLKSDGGAGWKLARCNEHNQRPKNTDQSAWSTTPSHKCPVQNNNNCLPWFRVLMLLRDGSCPGMVVRDRVHTLHRPEELSSVRQWERNCGPQPQFRDRLPVWLDLLREIWSSRGERKSPTNVVLFGFFFVVFFLSFKCYCSFRARRY